MQDPKDFLKECDQARNIYTAAEQAHFSALDAPYAAIYTALATFPESGDIYREQKDKCGNYFFCTDGPRRTIRFIENHYDDSYSWRNGREPAEFLRNNPEQRHLGHSYRQAIADHVAPPRGKSDSYHPACIFEVEEAARCALNTISIGYADAAQKNITIIRADIHAAEHVFKNSAQLMQWLKAELEKPEPPLLIPDIDGLRVITPYTATYAVTDTAAIAADIAAWAVAMAVRPETPQCILRQLQSPVAHDTAALSPRFDAAAQDGKATAGFTAVLEKSIAARRDAGKNGPAPHNPPAP